MVSFANLKQNYITALGSLGYTRRYYNIITTDTIMNLCFLWKKILFDVKLPVHTLNT